VTGETVPATPTNRVAPTSRWMAAARARESERADPLLHDPLAAALAGPQGFAWLGHMKAAAWSHAPGLYPVIRARFFDEFVLDACWSAGVRQVVLTAAGLDARAFRLRWPTGTRLYELDLPEVLSKKDDVIGQAGATPNCDRLTVGVDLRDVTWPEALLARGYRPQDGSVWLIEGLLYYLAKPDVNRLLETVGRLTATESLLGLDVMNRGLFFSPPAWPMQVALALRGAPGRFGTDDPETLLARHGFDAEVTQPGDHDANFGRWPRPLLSRDVPGWPRSFLVRAKRA